MIERLLLRDRAGPSRGLPRNASGTGNSGTIAHATHAVLSGSPHQDATGAAASAAAAAAAAAAAVAGRRTKMVEEGSPIRHPTPQHVKAVMCRWIYSCF